MPFIEVNIEGSTSKYTFPNTSGSAGGDMNVTFSKNVPLTVLPIPDIESPFLLNFGGVTIDMQVSWITTTLADLQFFTSTTLITVSGASHPFVSADVTATYTLNMTDVWGSAAIFVGVISSFSISQVAGEGNKWSCQMNLKIGQQVT